MKTSFPVVVFIFNFLVFITYSRYFGHNPSHYFLRPLSSSLPPSPSSALMPDFPSQIFHDDMLMDCAGLVRSWMQWPPRVLKTAFKSTLFRLLAPTFFPSPLPKILWALEVWSRFSFSTEHQLSLLFSTFPSLPAALASAAGTSWTWTQICV